MDADEWNERYDSEELVWSAEPNQFVEELCRDLEPGRAIDLAAGEGRNAVWLATRGWDATAVDFSTTGLDKAARRATENNVDLTVVRADLTEWQPAIADYDLVVIAYLQLPHDQERRIIANAAAAVAPGGSFVFVAHDRSNVADGHGGPQDENVLPDPELVTSRLDGFDVTRAEVAERRVQTDNGIRVALDTVVQAFRQPAPAG